MAHDEEIPRGRLSRFAKLARAGARVGASALVKRESDAAVRKAAAALGTLRGVAAKVGQMAAYVDGLVPEDQRDAYEKWMSRLMAATPPSSPESVARTIEEELGAPPSELFARFDQEPMASASIGQVHRADLHDGRAVVVKVQHEGVAAAVEADLKNAGLIERTVNLSGATKKLETRRVYEQIRARFTEELDYELEARRQRRFAELHRGHPRVRIPEVVAERSSRRVLTTELATGLTLDEAVAAPEADRVAWAETLWHFVFKGTLVGGVFNADPHPRNYFFAPNGQVWFIDFGCVQELDDDHREHATKMHLAAVGGDDAGFDDGVRALLELRGGAYEERALAYVREAFRPLSESPYRLTRPYVADLVERFRQIAKQAVVEKDDDFVAMPDGMFFMNRLQFGFYSVVARLDCEVDFASVERGFLLP